MFVCECVDSFEEPEFYSHKIVTSRKSHKCSECKCEIKPGDQYEYVFGKWGDKCESYYTCSICLAIRKDHMTCGWIHGYLWENLREIYADHQYEDEIDFDWLSEK